MEVLLIIEILIFNSISADVHYLVFQVFYSLIYGHFLPCYVFSSEVAYKDRHLMIFQAGCFLRTALFYSYPYCTWLTLHTLKLSKLMKWKCDSGSGIRGLWGRDRRCKATMVGNLPAGTCLGHYIIIFNAEDVCFHSQEGPQSIWARVGKEAFIRS